MLTGAPGTVAVNVVGHRIPGLTCVTSFGHREKEDPEATAVAAK